MLFIIIGSLICLVTACDSNETVDHREFIFLAHTRVYPIDIDRLDPNVEQLRFDKYDLVLLGGDMLSNTSGSDSAMTYLDRHFNLGSSNTLWALGNHDDSDLERITKWTKRADHYAHHQWGTTFLVWNTQSDNSSITGAQLDLLRNVADTITESKNLVIIMHKMIFMYDHLDLESQVDSFSNARIGLEYDNLINPNNFYEEVYPILKKIKSKGIEVVLIAGDLGVKAYEFEYKTAEGIYFLGSGITEGSPRNRALIISQNVGSGKLSWRHVLITDLLKQQESTGR